MIFGALIKILVGAFAVVPAPLLWIMLLALVGALVGWLRLKIREGA